MTMAMQAVQVKPSGPKVLRIGIIQGGKIVACGTMTELRHQFAAGDASLEDLFLRLTGGVSTLELGNVLDR